MAKEGAVELAIDDPRHGSFNGYNNCGCRCTPCQAANVAKMQELRAQRQANIDPDDPRHGKATFYSNHGCRCEKCRKANAEYAAERSKIRKAAKQQNGKKVSGKVRKTKIVKKKYLKKALA